MAGHIPRWDDRSYEEWIDESARFEKMAERLDYHPQLKASFSALAREAVVRAKDGRLTAARIVAGAEWRQVQFSNAANSSTSANIEYFQRRESQERLAASQSSDLRVRRVHLEMAIRYGALVGPSNELPDEAAHHS